MPEAARGRTLWPGCRLGNGHPQPAPAANPGRARAGSRFTGSPRAPPSPPQREGAAAARFAGLLWHQRPRPAPRPLGRPLARARPLHGDQGRVKGDPFGDPFPCRRSASRQCDGPPPGRQSRVRGALSAVKMRPDGRIVVLPNCVQRLGRRFLDDIVAEIRGRPMEEREPFGLPPERQQPLSRGRYLL